MLKFFQNVPGGMGWDGMNEDSMALGKEDGYVRIGGWLSLSELNVFVTRGFGRVVDMERCC